MRRRTFICYAHKRPDREVAVRLYADLKASGQDPWLDIEDLRPGDVWADVIPQVIRACKYFLALLSTRSLTKRGFVQNELRVALEVLNTIPVDQRFLIPIRLNECKPRDERLQRLHRCDLFPDYEAGLHHLLSALKVAAPKRAALWSDVPVAVPSDIASWPEKRLCAYVNSVLKREALDQARRDYENTSVRDLEKAIRERVDDIVRDVATHYGFGHRLGRCAERRERSGR